MEGDRPPFPDSPAHGEPEAPQLPHQPRGDIGFGDDPPGVQPPGGTPPGGEPPPETNAPIPWEQPGRGFFDAFYETLRLLIATPRKAFGRVPITSAILRPLGFAILISWPGLLVGTLWEIALRPTMEGLLPWAADQRMARSPVLDISVALAAPIWMPFALFLTGVVQHLLLSMTGGAKRGFMATFRAICYAQVSSLLLWIPLCGAPLGALWYLVLLVIGLSTMHRTPIARVVFAQLLGLFLCCGCLALTIYIFGAALMSAIGSSP